MDAGDPDNHKRQRQDEGGGDFKPDSTGSAGSAKKSKMSAMEAQGEDMSLEETAEKLAILNPPQCEDSKLDQGTRCLLSLH